MTKNVIGFIGTGNMAQAIMKGVYASGLKDKYYLYGYDLSKKSMTAMKQSCKMIIAKSNIEVAEQSDFLVLAVKPQVIPIVLKEIAKTVTKNTVIISIVAGVTTAKIKKMLGKSVPVVRIMPNTPALISEGACGYAFSGVGVEKGKEAIKIIEAFNKVSIKLSEKDINTVTALSGSGPAYFFYFAEAMIEAAVKNGISKKSAKALVAQTMIGAGKMIVRGNDEPEVLRAKVTSKGGTTEKAILSMKKNKVKDSLKCAITAAKKRADELGK